MPSIKKKDVKKNFSQKLKALILGIIVAFIVLEIVLRLGGLVFLLSQDYRNAASLRNKSATYRIMCLGESTTGMGGVFSYPSQLEEILKQRNIGVKFSVVNLGIPAGNTTAILAELEDNLNTYRPAMVIAMMGANDGGDYALYKEDFDRKEMGLSEVFRTYKLARFLWFFVVNKKATIRGNNSGSDIADVIKYPTQPRSRKEIEAMARKLYGQVSPGLNFFTLANDYMRQAKYKEASECYEKVIETGFQREIMKIDPKNIWIYFSLGECYKKQGRFKDAIESYKKIVEVLPDVGYAELAALYKEEGQYELAEEYFRKAREFRKGYYNAVTRHNYQKLKEILDLRRIKLVSVQYPTRSLEPLRKMLYPQEGIIFVDNESVFKKAIELSGYNKYFVDACYGDFGHGTKAGNNLLAENIANCVLREVFLVHN